MAWSLKEFDKGAQSKLLSRSAETPNIAIGHLTTAGRFEALLDSGAGLPPCRCIEFMEAEFIRTLKTSNLHYWRPGYTVAGYGRRLLLGALAFSPVDLRVLDHLDSTLPGKSDDSTCRIDVFSLSEAPSLQRLERYFPGFDGRTLSPLVGVWIDGVKREYACGERAQAILTEFYPQLERVRV